MDRLPLDIAKVPPVLKKYLGEGIPAGLKMVAARGLVPLKPVESVTLLYCFHFDPDPQVVEAAQNGIRGLAPQVLNAVLDTPLDPQVLDMLAEVFGDRPDVVSRIILNRNTADETVEILAQTGSEQTIDLIANNQVRYLRTPGIVRAMHGNPFARQATLDAVLELAQRNGINTDELLGITPPAPPPGEPAADGNSVIPSGRRDPAAAEPQAPAAAGGDTDGPGDLAAKVPSHYLQHGVEFTDQQSKDFIAWMQNAPEDLQMRLALHGNSASGILLAKTRCKDVALALFRNKNIEMMRHWTKIAGDRQANEDLIKALCTKKEFTMVYSIKAKLALNPKTPPSNSMGFVRSMRLSDLKTIARNKSVAVTLQNTAKGILKMHGVNIDAKK
jgi:hypothetical protein